MWVHIFYYKDNRIDSIFVSKTLATNGKKLYQDTSIQATIDYPLDHNIKFEIKVASQ